MMLRPTILIGWFGAGFLASGAAATDEVVEEAATPFRSPPPRPDYGHGGCGPCGRERGSLARDRGIQPICEVLSAVTANSAFHGTRLDVQHIGQVMENLIAQAEAHSGIRTSSHCAAHRLRFPRNLHAGTWRQRVGRDQRSASRLRRRCGPNRHRQHQGFHWPRHGYRNRGSAGGESPGNGCGSARG